MGILPELSFLFIQLLRASHDAHYTAIARFSARSQSSYRVVPSEILICAHGCYSLLRFHYSCR